jgi:hypothetical protein
LEITATSFAAASSSAAAAATAATSGCLYAAGSSFVTLNLRVLF